MAEEFILDSDLTTPKEGTIGYVLWEFGNEMQEKLRESAQREGNYVNGNLAESVEFSTKVMGTTITFQLKLDDYWDYVNKGVNGTEVHRNSPYSRKTKLPPASKLAAWGVEKGLVRGTEAKSFGYAVAKSMQKKGMKGSHFYDKVVTADRLNKLRTDLTKAASKDITQITSNIAKSIFIKK